MYCAAYSYLHALFVRLPAYPCENGVLTYADVPRHMRLYLPAYVPFDPLQNVPHVCTYVSVDVGVGVCACNVVA